MLHSIALLGSLTLLVLSSSCSKQNDVEGWIDLFDGKTLKGWTPNFEDQQIAVKDGIIQLLSVKKNLWLVHQEVFKDFELEADIKAPLENYNTGIAFRCDPTPVGYQCEIYDKQTGSLYGIKRGWIFPPTKEEMNSFYTIAKDCYTPGEWNHYRIRCVGDHIQIWVNGHKTTDIHDSTFKQGRVAIQHHGRGDVHYFKNIRIRRLP